MPARPDAALEVRLAYLEERTAEDRHLTRQVSENTTTIATSLAVVAEQVGTLATDYHENLRQSREERKMLWVAVNEGDATNRELILRVMFALLGALLAGGVAVGVALVF